MSDRPTAHILTGLPASGKTSLARTLYPALRFNMDDARAMAGMTHDRFDRDTERVIFAAMLAGAKAAIEAGRDIVLDSTHLVPAWPREYRKVLGPLGVEFKVHDLTNVPVAECIARDAAREHPVGEAVIRRLADNHAKARKGWRLTEKWMRVEQAPTPKPYEPPIDKPTVYLCDIDGTVAINDGHRGRYDYDKVAADKPNWPVIRTVVTLSVRAEIIFMSGREDRCRADTVAWLMHHFGFAYPPQLFMRTTGDHRADNIVKIELFDAHIRDNYHVLGAFDDRDRVVAAWRSLGLTCYQVGEGNF